MAPHGPDQLTTAKVLLTLAGIGLLAADLVGSWVIAGVSLGAAGVGTTAAVRHRHHRRRGHPSTRRRASRPPALGRAPARRSPSRPHQPHPLAPGGEGRRRGVGVVHGPANPFGTTKGARGGARGGGCSSAKCAYSKASVAQCTCACKGRAHGTKATTKAPAKSGKGRNPSKQKKGQPIFGMTPAPRRDQSGALAQQQAKRKGGAA